MRLLWEERAWEDYLYWQTQDKKTLKKVNTLIKDIQRNPFEGIGKPEALKITQRVKNVIVEPDDYIIRSDVTDGNYWLLDLHWICDVAWSDNESAIIVCTDGMMYDIQLYY